MDIQSEVQLADVLQLWAGTLRELRRAAAERLRVGNAYAVRQQAGGFRVEAERGGIRVRNQALRQPQAGIEAV
jgi:hypothetical protein